MKMSNKHLSTVDTADGSKKVMTITKTAIPAAQARAPEQMELRYAVPSAGFHVTVLGEREVGVAACKVTDFKSWLFLDDGWYCTGGPLGPVWTRIGKAYKDDTPKYCSTFKRGTRCYLVATELDGLAPDTLDAEIRGVTSQMAVSKLVPFPDDTMFEETPDITVAGFYKEQEAIARAFERQMTERGNGLFAGAHLIAECKAGEIRWAVVKKDGEQLRTADGEPLTISFIDEHEATQGLQPMETLEQFCEALSRSQFVEGSTAVH
jgi:hypothetical protein